MVSPFRPLLCFTLLLYLASLIPGVIQQTTEIPISEDDSTTFEVQEVTSAQVDTSDLQLNCTSDQALVDLKCIDKDLKGNNSSLVQLILVTGISVCWVIYLTYFHSRVIGFILTRILNQIYKDGYIKFGSFSVSVLSGKVMFRDLQFITPDLSLRIYDGYCIFRWWRPYKFSPWRKKRDLNQGHTRLSVVLYGVEYHVYNRSHEYQRLEKLFGLDSEVLEKKPDSNTKKLSGDSDLKESAKVAWWRSLIPVIKFSVACGKVIFGNKLLPSTLVIAFEDAAFQYKTTKASNKYDSFMHAVEGSLGSTRFMLVPNSKYDPATLPPHLQGQVGDSPPRMMSEGFDLIHSNNVHFKYAWDEPGRTNRPLEQSKFSADQPSPDDITSPLTTLDESPVWELEVRCKRRATLNYGPWADRQIFLLWRFFYPIDYQDLEVTPRSEDGQPRAAISFKMYLNLLHESDVDLLFLENNEPNAIHINLGKGSCIEMNVPMVVDTSGFVTQVSGRLLFPEATTSMLYRPLLAAETLSFNVNAHYPIRCNENQMWACDIKATKASASLVFAHKNFIADLMDDWASKESPDLMRFSPYKMKFQFDLQDFELLLPANEHNWVDCSTRRKENALVGLCGRSLSIGFTLPFDSFLAPTYTIPFDFLVCNAELCLFLPLSNPSRNILLNLSNGMVSWNTSNSKNAESETSNIGKKTASHLIQKDPSWGLINADWVKCWDAPEMSLTISYTWHPILAKPKEDFKGSLSSKEMERAEKLMQHQSSKPAKMPLHKRSMSASDSALDSGDVTPLLHGTNDSIASSIRSKITPMVTFDPTTLDPDEIRVEFYLKPGSTLFLYGSLLHHFLAIKENYLGVDDVCTDFDDGQHNEECEEKDRTEQILDPLYYRTLQVTVNVNLHDINGVLPIHPNPVLKSCPAVRLKRLTFEMDKNYHQTRLQLLLSKLVITTEENMDDVSSLEGVERRGWLTLLDLQLRGHAMFSGAGLPVGAVTIEYGWLTEVLVGPIIGNLTIPQIQFMVQWAQSFVFLFKNSTHEMKPAFPNRYLPTGITWDYEKQDGTPVSEVDVKYLMAQVKLESIMLRVEENNSVLDMAVSPVLISNGNVQFPGVKEAASIRVQEVVVKHRIKNDGNLDGTPSDIGKKWVEAGEVRFGSLYSMITVAMAEREMCEMQSKFLHFHDKKTRRLQFIWQDGGMDGSGTSSQNTALSSVQALKSWGCNFFTPLTSKHPTYFYYKNKKSSTFRNPHRRSTFHAFDDESGSSSESSDSQERDSDVFDAGMDYGMSLLTDGKCLLSRSRTESDMLKQTHDSSSSTSEAGCGDTKESIGSGIVVAHNGEAVFKKQMTSDFSVKGPSLRRQGKISGSAGCVPSLIPLKSPSPSVGQGPCTVAYAKASSIRKPRSQTVNVPLESVGYTQQQVSFAPSPEKVDMVKKSVSHTDLDNSVNVERRSITRAMSSESNLYRSAESDFKSTTSLSSAADDFYSAESDMNESNRNSAASDSILLAVAVVNDTSKSATSEDVAHVAPRPGTLVLTNETSGQLPISSNNLKSKISPSTIEPSSLSPMSGESLSVFNAQLKSPSPSAGARRQQNTILACYESYLTLLQMKSREESESATGQSTPDSEDVGDEFYDDKNFVLPEFIVLRDGVHPSVMIDRSESTESPERHHRKMDSTHRELSFDDIDSSGKSTSVSVHLKESLDVQLTPFLLETVTHLLAAAMPVVQNDNPLAVISQLQMDCVEDAAVRVPDDDSNYEKGVQEKDGIEKVKSSVRQRLSKVASNDSQDAAGSINKSTRPPLGTKLCVKMDKVRVNILQATLGDDRIFGLWSSKLLPAPCITMLSARLDSLQFSVDLNNRRKNRLLLENYRKSSRTSSVTSERKTMESEPSFANISSVSDVSGLKHFLVLLNMKANAQSVGMQMRALTCDGSVPDMTAMTALSDKACKAPFEFNPSVALPHVKAEFERWRKGEPLSSRESQAQRKDARSPPKLWGWVMLEAGVYRVKLNIIKQLPIGAFPVSTTKFTPSSQFCMELPDSLDGAEEQCKPGLENSSFSESVHVHFMDQSMKSAASGTLGGQSALSLVHDTGLHSTQGELFVGSVWINVPSPSPRNTSSSSALRTWNLLTCMSASINCWLDPADRLASMLTNFKVEILRRQCAVAACVLTEAFDDLTAGEGGPEKAMEPIQHKYDVLTKKTMYLRKDSNFLLCHELQRFLSNEPHRQVVLAAVGPTDFGRRSVPPLPALSTLKKGVAALIRQWTGQYAGVIASTQHTGKFKKASHDLAESSILYSTEDDSVPKQMSKDSVAFHRPSLVVEVEIPGDTVSHGMTSSYGITMVSQHPNTTPQKKQFSKSDTFTSLSAIAEGVSLKSGVDIEDLSRDKPTPSQLPVTQKGRQPHLLRMTSTEELVHEQQQSMYSWMQNAAKASSPPKAREAKDDVEAQLDPDADVFVMEVDNKNGDVDFATENGPQRNIAQVARQALATKQITDYEEVFAILLRNIGIHSMAPVSQKSDASGSFVGTECLGSLSVAMNLKQLRVEKQDADFLYTSDGISRRKRRSAKTRKQRSFYSSLEHAREPRSTGSINTSTWPHLATTAVQTAPQINPPILVCREIALKSSMIESEAENREGTKLSSVPTKSKLEASVQTHFSKNKSTLKVGVELSVSSIVQHVDVSLIRLVHQIAQISDSVKQAQTDIQVNKYTEGSVSPDIKVLHRRTESNISGNSVDTQPNLKRTLSVDHDGVHESIVSMPDSDDDGAGSTSTASTEVAHCWQIMYKMVDLYNTVPENKMEIIPKDTMRVESEALPSASELTTAESIYRRTTFSFARHDPYMSLVLLGVAKIDKVEMRAAVGDLRLEAEVLNLVSSADHKKEVENAFKHVASSEFKTTLDAINIKLLDVANARAPSKKIATTSVKRSALIASTDHQRNSEKNVCRLELGLVSFDLSQHPASLHDVVSRGSRQLSMHITEFVQTPAIRQPHEYDVVDAPTPYVLATPAPSSTVAAPMTPVTPSALTTLIDFSQDSSSAVASTPVNARFELESNGIKVVASLLPSLRAQYETGKISGEGRTGLDATFFISMPSHYLQFTTENTAHEYLEERVPTVIDLPEIRVEGDYKQQAGDDENIPFSGKWSDEKLDQRAEAGSSNLQLRSGDYLSVRVKIGSFEHSLTTDLLNQLVFLQEVFVKEMNEMFDKVSKSSRPVPLWSETSLRSEISTSEKPLLYQLKLTLQGIQITAATPSCNAVRLKTGEMMFELSNRVIQNKRVKKKKKKGLSMPKYLKLFGKAQVDLTLSLGMLVRNTVYPEAEDEFQQLAYFTTRIGLQNTRQGKEERSKHTGGSAAGCSSGTTFESTGSPSASTSASTRATGDFVDSDSLRAHLTPESSDNSVILISLKRPIFFIQPTAFDKAILVYLSYKTAYEDWKEQQENVWKMARQMRDVLHSSRSQPTSTTSVPKQAQQQTSTVFLQLSVNDLGICLPVTQDIQLHEATSRDELSSALVLTIDSTLISAYYSRSLVTKGHLKGFCLRFADDFQTSWDDWKQNAALGSSGGIAGSSPLMNACVVPEGTYEICSDTTTHHSQVGAPPVAKTTVNVFWKMMGVDLHMDTKIGSYFSRLTDTLMAITGQDESSYDADLDIEMSQSEEDGDHPEEEDEVDGVRRSRSTTVTSTISSSSTLRMQKEKTRKIEHELNEQVKVVNDLRQLGAKKSVIDEEERRMHELEVALSSNFRRVVRTRLRRSSMKTGSKKEPATPKFKPTHQRAKSATTFTSRPSPLPPRPSHSAHSTLPRDTLQEDWFDSEHDERDQAVAGGRMLSTGFSISPKNVYPSPLTYDSDHVFPPSPEKKFPAGSLELGDEVSQSDVTDNNSSDDDDDVPDFGMASAQRQVETARRSLYPGRLKDEAGSKPAPPQLPTSKSESYLANMSHMTTGPEVDLQLALDVRVEVDGGRIECHPYPQEVEVTLKTDYGILQPPYNKPKTGSFVKNTTIFYIPAVDVKVHYNSASSEEALTGSGSKENESRKSQNEESAESPEYSTPPPVALEKQSPKLGMWKDGGIPQKIDEEKILVPEIEITTPSHFANKGKKFVLPDASPVLGRRRACVYARLAMQSLPEMVISPYLLDFVEQTLSEIETMVTPAHSSQKHSTASSNFESPYDSFACSEEDDGSDIEPSEADDNVLLEGSVLSSESPLVSLPLDVVVSVNVQPSQVRFNCVPLSRVECLLQIPGMDLVFSSIQDDLGSTVFSTGNLSESSNKKSKQQPGKFESGQSMDSTSNGNSALKISSGLSFSAILSDFSIYIFHPYGGKQPTGSVPLDLTGSFVGSPTAGATESPFQKSGSGRRDSLSVNLEFVKINLVRRKKGETILVADVSSPGGGRSRVDNVIIHLSGLVDIGKASFKYDMRRLGEILSFPRAWYRRSIARRLFLGDTNEQTHTSQSTPPPKPKEVCRPRSSTKASQSRSRTYTNPIGADSSILSFLSVDTPLSPQQRPLVPRNFNHVYPFSPNTTSTYSPAGELSGSLPGCAFIPIQWRATVLLCLNMSRLDVEMNMSNVMGNTVWSCDALRSQGRLTFQSEGDKDIILTCSLDNSQLTARGGIIGGQVELKEFNADCHLLDPAEGDPLHKLSLRAQSLDGRIEYMGGCAMLGQLTHADMQLKDEWRDPMQSIPSTMDKGTVFVHCDLGWRVFQLSISRSTTPDVIKMLNKLEEFFSQQLHSSVRAISSWTRSHPRPVSPKKFRDPASGGSETQEKVQYDHRRHWPPVFKAVSEAIAKATLSSTQKQLQNRSFLLGGSACLHGDGLTVVCFHGGNFRARSWVLFNILQPNIVFSTEVQEIKESVSGDETSTLAIQSLTVNLGHDLWLSRTVKATDPMATVSRVTRSRNQNPPPGSAAISEWFAYMTASHNEELKMLRTLNDISASGTGAGQGAAASINNSFNKSFSESTSGTTYSHEADIIFALPKVQLDFKTEHMQGPGDPDPEDPDNKPVVECSFVTEFTDHICVTMDVELILFLHDLVSSYLKEKQQSLSSRTKLPTLNTSQWGSMDGSFTTGERKLSSLPLVDPIDLREFVCNTWQLEPTVRLISWAGRRIEPVGVDYILQKLGFQHARTTIPKWFQRGVLDPLDKGLAAIVQKLVVAIISQQKKDV